MSDACVWSTALGSSDRRVPRIAAPPRSCIFLVYNRSASVCADVFSPFRCVVSLTDAREARRGLDVVEVEMIAHVLPAGVAERLEVPGMMRAGRQGGGDEMAAGLAGAHPLPHARQVPARRAFVAEAPYRRPRQGVGRQIAALVRIGGEIVKLIGVGGGIDEFMRAAAGH